jgi:hypothetical protein
MQRINVLLFLLVVCFATAMQAQAPDLGPLLKKLSPLVGHWTYDGEYKAGPLGHGGKVAGEYDGETNRGGFLYQGRWTEKGATGARRDLYIYGYDAVNENFSIELRMRDGSRVSGALTASGKTFTWTGKGVVAGKEYQFKGTFVLAADLMRMTDKAEISIDGKRWTPFFEGKYTKAGPAQK